MAERGLNRPSVIWRVMPDGQIRTVAGGRLRYKPEPGGQKTVGTPDGLVVAGNLAYWTDSFGNQVLATEFGPVEKARTVATPSARRRASSTQNSKLKTQNFLRRFGPVHVAPRTTEHVAARKPNPKPQTPNPRQQTTQRRLLRSYVYGPSGLLAVIENNETRYLTPDHLGSPRVVTDSAGAVVSRRDFEPFGQEIPVGVGGRNAFDGYGAQDGIRERFATYERDDETGLDFAQARFYAPNLGRFMSPDPIAGDVLAPQGLNLYAYVLNNPLKMTDPTGLKPKQKNPPPPKDPINVGEIDVVEVKAPPEPRKRTFTYGATLVGGVYLGAGGNFVLFQKIFGLETDNTRLAEESVRYHPKLGFVVTVASGVVTGGLVGKAAQATLKGGLTTLGTITPAAAVEATVPTIAANADEIGTAIGNAVKGQPGSMGQIVQQVGAQGLSHADTVTALQSAIKATGRNSVAAAQADGSTVVASVMTGFNKPVLVVSPNGVISNASATIQAGVRNGAPFFEVTNIVPK